MSTATGLLLNDLDDQDNDEDLMDMEEEDEEAAGVNAIFKANIIDDTRKGYQRSQRRFACWIYDQWVQTQQEKYRLLLHPEVYAALMMNNTIQTAAPIIGRANPSFHPINLSLMKIEEFFKFLLSLTKKGVYLSCLCCFDDE
jgi:hypothetical protein